MTTEQLLAFYGLAASIAIAMLGGLGVLARHDYGKFSTVAWMTTVAISAAVLIGVGYLRGFIDGQEATLRGLEERRSFDVALFRLDMLQAVSYIAAAFLIALWVMQWAMRPKRD